MVVVYAHGGDVFKFAGDALLAVWVQNADDSCESTVMRATQVRSNGNCVQNFKFCGKCAWEVMLKMNDRNAKESLCLHIGVAAGDLALLQVGGKFGRSEVGVAGVASLQLLTCCAVFGVWRATVAVGKRGSSSLSRLHCVSPCCT